MSQSVCRTRERERDSERERERNKEKKRVACEPTHISSSVMYAAVDANFLFLSPEKKSSDCQSTLFLSLLNILFISSLIRYNTVIQKTHSLTGLWPLLSHRLHSFRMPTAKEQMPGRFDCVSQVTQVPSKGVRYIKRKKIIWPHHSSKQLDAI